jgi:hypothetical protein
MNIGMWMLAEVLTIGSLVKVLIILLLRQLVCGDSRTEKNSAPFLIKVGIVERFPNRKGIVRSVFGVCCSSSSRQTSETNARRSPDSLQQFRRDTRRIENPLSQITRVTCEWQEYFRILRVLSLHFPIFQNLRKDQTLCVLKNWNLDSAVVREEAETISRDGRCS